MARRREFVRGAGAIMQRRLSTWFQFPPATTTQSSAGGAIVFSLNAAALALRPFTIVRTRFDLLLLSDQTAANEEFGMSWGAAVVSDQATAVGVTAVPTPVTDQGSDLWFALGHVWGAIAANAVARTGYRMAIDSRAMRKVDVGQDIVVVVESMTATVGGGSEILQVGRMLAKVN